MKVFGSGNESTRHNAVKLEPIFTPTVDLFSFLHLGASEIIDEKLEPQNGFQTYT